MSFIPKSVSDRFIEQVEKFQKVLEVAVGKGIPKSGTVTLVADILAEVFGYDKYTEITGEFSGKGTKTDLAVRTEDAIDFIVVVAAIGTELKTGQIKAAAEFGAKEGVSWVVNTNGVTWEINRVRGGKRVGIDPICTFHFPQIAPRKAKDQEQIFLLTREGLKKGALEGYHYQQVVNRFKIGAIIQSDSILEGIRADLRELSGGIEADVKELSNIIAKEVLKDDLVDGEAAREAQSWLRKAQKKG
jgi:predicted type IV restriction endonuclease